MNDSITIDSMTQLLRRYTTNILTLSDTIYIMIGDVA